VVTVLSLEAFVRRGPNHVFLTDLMVSHEIAMSKEKLLDQVHRGGVSLIFRVKPV